MVTWKPGQNYKLDVLAARGTRVLVVETWDDGPRHVEVDVQGSDGNTIQLQAGASVIQQEVGGFRTVLILCLSEVRLCQHAEPCAASPKPGRASLTSNCLQAEAAMSELKEALDRQVQTMQRVTGETYACPSCVHAACHKHTCAWAASTWHQHKHACAQHFRAWKSCA